MSCFVGTLQKQIDNELLTAVKSATNILLRKEKTDKYFIQIHNDFSELLTEKGAEIYFQWFVQHVGGPSSTCLGFQVVYESPSLWLFFPHATEGKALKCKTRLDQFRSCDPERLKQGLQFLLPLLSSSVKTYKERLVLSDEDEPESLTHEISHLDLFEGDWYHPSFYLLSIELFEAFAKSYEKDLFEECEVKYKLPNLYFTCRTQRT